MPDAMRAASLELTDSFKRLKIRDYEAIEEIFANALERDKWPVNDKAFDHYAKALKLRRKLAEMEDTEEGGMATKRLKGNKSKVSKKNLDCVWQIVEPCGRKSKAKEVDLFLSETFIAHVGSGWLYFPHSCR